jgi:hypothetical protein
MLACGETTLSSNPAYDTGVRDMPVAEYKSDSRAAVVASSSSRLLRQRQTRKPRPPRSRMAPTAAPTPTPAIAPGDRPWLGSGAGV